MIAVIVGTTHDVVILTILCTTPYLKALARVSAVFVVFRASLALFFDSSSEILTSNLFSPLDDITSTIRFSSLNTKRIHLEVRFLNRQ